jgi:hypothetical protein
MRLARPPERFARALAKALDDRAPFARHAVGPDARMLLISNRVLPSAGLHHVTRVAMGIPRQGALRGRAVSLTMGQRAMMLAARVLPAPVLQRLTLLAMRFSRNDNNSTTPESENHG